MADNKRCWKIIYSRYEGLEKKALDLVSAELGSYVSRDAGVYSLYVLPCEKAETAVIDSSAVILGVYSENALLRRYIEESEIPENEILLIAAYDNLGFFMVTDYVVISQGIEDVAISGKTKFNPSKGNPFLFEIIN